MKLSSRKPNSLGELSEEELLVLLSHLKCPEVISRIALGNSVGWHLVYKEHNISGSPPQWLASWAAKIEVAPLFSIGEGDPIQGVAYILSDFSANEFWLGVAGGLREVVESPDLIKIPCSDRKLTASDVYPVWTNLLSYEHPHHLSDIFDSGFKVYDESLLPSDHLIKFKNEAATMPKRSGCFGITSRYIQLAD